MNVCKTSQLTRDVRLARSVPAGSWLDGRSPPDARLANGSVQVFKLFQDKEEWSPPAPETRLQTGDRLVVHSRSSAMVDLRRDDLIGLHTAPAPPGAGQDLEPLRQRDVVIVEALMGGGYS